MENIFDNGNIKISDDVIATISTIAVSEIDGVHGMGGSFAGDIVEKFSKKSLTKGVKSTVEGDTVCIDLNIIVKYGVRIPEIAWNIQENVKKSVESMTGLTVAKVNVRVVGVEVDKNAAPEEKSIEPESKENNE